MNYDAVAGYIRYIIGLIVGYIMFGIFKER